MPVTSVKYNILRGFLGDNFVFFGCRIWWPVSFSGINAPLDNFKIPAGKDIKIMKGRKRCFMEFPGKEGSTKLPPVSCC